MSELQRTVEAATAARWSELHPIRIGARREQPVGPGHEREAMLRSLHAQGATLEEAGEALGVSRERVRQLNAELGLAARGADERRVDWVVAHRASDVRRAFLEVRKDAEVASRLGLRTSTVRAAVDELIPHADLLRGRPRARQPTYSDRELVQLLTVAAASMESPMPHHGYAAWAKGQSFSDGRLFPGHQTMVLRWGSWRAALERAGLAVGPRSGPHSEITRATAIAAVASCWRDVGHPPTVQDYDTWSPGREEAPSSATVRKFVDGWLDGQLSAWEQIYETELPRTDLPNLDTSPAVAQPSPLGYPAPAASDRAAGRAYREADEAAAVDGAGEFVFDAMAHGVARRAHARLQNTVAALAAQAGWSPLSPGQADPQWDVAWRQPNGMLVICEIKSAENATLEKQLRAALGQVLRYGALVESRGMGPVSLAIAVELPPDEAWRALARRLNVTLGWPPNLSSVFVNPAA